MPHTPVFLVGSGAHDTATPDVHTATDRYAQRFAGGVGSWMLERQSTGVQRLLGDAVAGQSDRPLRILDVGGGHGQLTAALLAAGHEVFVHGSDSSCFAKVKRDFGEADGFQGCVAASLWRLPFADNSFDVVIGVRLLAHVRAWQALLAEMTRVSRRWVLLEFARTHELGERKLGRVWFNLKKRIERSTRPFYTYDEHAVRHALSDLGFVARSVDAQFALPVLLHRVMHAPMVSRAAEAMLTKLGAGVAHRSPVLLLAERGSAAKPAVAPDSPMREHERREVSANASSRTW